MNNNNAYVYWFKILISSADFILLMAVLLILFGFFFYVLFHICTKQNAAPKVQEKKSPRIPKKEENGIDGWPTF